MRRLRIAMLNRCFSTDCGGAERYAVALTEQLAERHEVHVFAQRIGHAHPGVTYHRLPSIAKPRWLNQLLFAALTGWHTRTGFDIVHSHENGWAGNVQTVHVRPMRHNLLTTARGLRRVRQWLKIVTGPRLPTYLWLEGARFRPCPGRIIAVVSEPLREEMRPSYPASADCLRIVPPGVAPVIDALDQAEARARSDLPMDATLLLFVANDYRRKGLDTVLEALAGDPVGTNSFVHDPVAHADVRINSHLRRHPVHLIVVGDPAQTETYRERARSLGLGGHVHFLGRQHDMSLVYAAADVLLHPTREDTFGMVVLEAMAHGLPVIVSRAPFCGLSASLDEGEALLLDDPTSASELAQAMRALLDDAERRSALAEAGRAVAARYNWAEITRQYESLYIELTEAHG